MDQQKCECGSTQDVKLVMMRAPGVNKWLKDFIPMCSGCRDKNHGQWRYAKKLLTVYSK